MRRLVPALVVLSILAASLLFAGASAAQLRALHLKRGVEVQALAAGPNGTLWLAGVDRADAPEVNFLTGMYPGRGPRTFVDRGSVGAPGIGELIRGPEGEMWFSIPGADEVDRLDPAAEVTHHLVLEPGEGPTGLVAAGGDVWATLAGVAEIAQIKPGPGGRGEGTTVNNWTVGPGSSLSRIVLGSDDNLWAIESGSGRVTRESLGGAYAPVALETGEESFAGTINSDIAAGEDGSIWVSQRDRPTVGKLVPDADGNGLDYTRYKVAGGPTTFLAPGPAGDIWFADQAGMIGSISPSGANGEPACAIKRCATPVTALARGPEGKIWFAAGGTVERFDPPPLALGFEKVARTIGRKGRLKMQIACRGGAGGQKCFGRVEIRQGSHILERTPYSAVTGSIEEIGVPLNTRVADLLRAHPALQARLVLVTASKVTDRRALDFDVG